MIKDNGFKGDPWGGKRDDKNVVLFGKGEIVQPKEGYDIVYEQGGDGRIGPRALIYFIKDEQVGLWGLVIGASVTSGCEVELDSENRGCVIRGMARTVVKGACNGEDDLGRILEFAGPDAKDEADAFGRAVNNLGFLIFASVIRITDPRFVKDAGHLHMRRYIKQFFPLRDQFVEAYDDFVAERPWLVDYGAKRMQAGGRKNE